MWQASDDKITWLNVPDAASAMSHRYVREVFYAPPPPIPEPAPELCAFPGCGTKEHDGQLVHTAHVSPELAVTMCPCRGRRDHITCHRFVAPHAKPVLREPKPFPVAGEAWAYAGHEIGEVSKVVNEKIYGDTLYFSNDHPPLFWNDGSAWTRVRPAQPAAKDIPSGATNAANPVAPHTEAARGGEAAITSRCIFCGTPGRHRCPQLTETGPSAVAAAPAIEPWRPSVDEWDLLPDASEGWRR